MGLIPEIQMGFNPVIQVQLSPLLYKDCLIRDYDSEEPIVENAVKAEMLNNVDHIYEVDCD